MALFFASQLCAISTFWAFLRLIVIGSTLNTSKVNMEHKSNIPKLNFHLLNRLKQDRKLKLAVLALQNSQFF